VRIESFGAQERVEHEALEAQLRFMRNASALSASWVVLLFEI